MAAYAAVTCLEHTLNQLLDSSPEIDPGRLRYSNIQKCLLTSTNLHISVIPSSRNVIRSALTELASVRQYLQKLCGCDRIGRRILDGLEGEIRDGVYKLEDVIEFHICDQIHSEAISFEEVRVEIESLIEELKKTKEVYIEELDNPSLEEQSDGDAAAAAAADSAGNGKRLVNVFGLDDDKIGRIPEQLTEHKSYQLCVATVIGKYGNIPTVYVKTAFEYIQIQSYDGAMLMAWVSVGPEYEVKDMLNSLLSQLDPHHHPDDDDKDEKWLSEQVYDKLKGRRYLIVLDSVCDTLVWDYLRSSFPEEYHSSRVLITTSLKEIAKAANSYKTYIVEHLLLSHCFHLIRKLVFNEGEAYDPKLEEAIMRIAVNSRGRHLRIIKAVLMLSKADKRPEKWNKIATDLEENSGEITYELSQIMEDQRLENLVPDSVYGHSRTYIAEVIEEVLLPHRVLNWLKSDMAGHRISDLTVVALYGMAGIGKTTLARNIFKDPSVLRCYAHRVWVTLNPKYRYDKLFTDILAQIDPDIGNIEDEIQAEQQISTLLSCKRCLFVLDDLWDTTILSQLSGLVKYTRFEVLITTRLRACRERAIFYNMSLLGEEQSWCLLRETVFAELSCPPELEKPGRMIAKECEGLPLMIVTVGGLLSQVEKTHNFWNEVATKKNSIFKQVYDKIYNILLPSYEYLDQELKPCFLYMAVFPQKYEISTFKLLELFSLERIFESDISKCLDDLDSNSLLLTRKMKRDIIKTSHLHSVFWHMCVRKARETKFFHVLNKIDDAQGINGQRRLCIHNNMLFGIKGMCASMTSNSAIRSLLCTGPYQQYPVPVCFSFTLLKTVDALAIRFYVFPIGVFELVQMKYLALTCNEQLTTSISRLRNLQYLIIRQHHNIKLMSEALLPVQIWDMKQLKHLQVIGGDLPDPCGAVLPNLVILLDVTLRSCTEGVFRGTPNLLKLGIRIELTPDTPESSFCFDHISHLSRLISLKCVVVNPEFMRPIPPLMFPPGLEKLSLSGLGYSWEYEYNW